jgi:prepilin-type N-terminal cleavage/methylation domain-containing protein
MHRARPGFTMLELAIAMTMLGIVAALALPKVRAGKQTADLRASREVVANLASQARRAAISRGAPVRLAFVSDADKRLEVRLDNGTRIAGPVDTYAQWKVTPSITGAVSYVRFDAHGLARDANGATRIVKLATASGKRDSVCISGAGMVMRGTCR